MHVSAKTKTTLTMMHVQLKNMKVNECIVFSNVAIEGMIKKYAKDVGIQITVRKHEKGLKVWRLA